MTGKKIKRKCPKCNKEHEQTERDWQAGKCPERVAVIARVLWRRHRGAQ